MPTDQREVGLTVDRVSNNFFTPAAMLEREPKPFEDPYMRRCLRLYRMVAILHGLGFQGLRIHPYIYPLGYRTELFPAVYSDYDGVRVRADARLDWTHNPNPEALRLLTSGGLTAEQLGAEHDMKLNARQMAIRFIESYPALASASYHLDYAYAGWFALLLGHCEFGQLPYLYAEFEPESGVMRLMKVGEAERDAHMEFFPLPPTASSGVRFDPRPRPPWMKDA